MCSSVGQDLGNPARLVLCALCGVPKIECFGPGQISPMLTESEACFIWRCDGCVEAASLHCSHCDEAIPEDQTSSELDDGSLLCKECTIELTEKLNEFTGNHQSDTK